MFAVAGMLHGTPATGRGAPAIPIYPFHCDACGAEFEVSRKISAMREPAHCPACGAEARRVFTPLALGGVAQDPATAQKAARPQPGGWSHRGHSHGAGTAGHSHGLWDQPKAPPGAGPTPGGGPGAPA